jgi:hypothetical protein
VQLCRRGTVYQLQWKKLRMDRESFREIVRYGLPTGVQNSVIGLANVLVQTKYGDVESDAREVPAEEPGAYTVEGTWTFSATRVKDRLGNLKDVAGYYTEELDARGNWTNKTWHEGEKEYPYNCETSPACVRLTWSVPPPGMILILR